jgi:DNA/RNA endonuclease YhcR with UshA esterase domain
MRRHGLSLIVLLLSAAAAVAQQKITPKEARNHVGENVTVCGRVASDHYAANTKGQPTFINLDEPYPRQIFTVVIWGSDRPAFGRIPADICVSGTVSLYKGIPEIIARSPSQISPN